MALFLSITVNRHSKCVHALVLCVVLSNRYAYSVCLREFMRPMADQFMRSTTTWKLDWRQNVRCDNGLFSRPFVSVFVNIEFESEAVGYN